MMDLHHNFVVSFKFLFTGHVVTNFITMMFLNLLDHNTTAYKYGYGAIFINFLISHLLAINVVFSRESAGINKPFHQWIWLTDNSCQRMCIFAGFIVWLIPNILVISEPGGVTYLMAIFGVFAIIYWVTVFGAMIHSWRTDSPANYTGPQV